MKCMIAVGLILTGALTMTAVADEPKNDEKYPAPKLLPKEEEKYPLKLVVKAWDKQGKQFTNPLKVNARKVEMNGAVAFFVIGKHLGSGSSPVTDSEVTDADGVVWLVKKGTYLRNAGEFMAEVEKKKKP